LRREPTAVIPPLRQRRDLRRSMLRVSSVHAARLTRLRARRVRLGSLGNLASRMARCARRVSRASQANLDKPASRDNVVSRDS
jgi:hypothetical protein